MKGILAFVLNALIWLVYIFAVLVPYGKQIIALVPSHNFEGMVSPLFWCIVWALVAAVVEKLVAALLVGSMFK